MWRKLQFSRFLLDCENVSAILLIVGGVPTHLRLADIHTLEMRRTKKGY